MPPGKPRPLHRAKQNMGACFIRASEQLGKGGWGVGAAEESPSFYPDLETCHCFCWSISQYFVWNSDRSEILLVSYWVTLPHYLCESLWVCMYTWVACIYQYTSAYGCIQTYVLANCAHTIPSWDLWIEDQTVSLPSTLSPGSPQRERGEARVPVCAVGFMHQFQVMKLRA